MTYTRKQIKHLVNYLKEFHHYNYEPIYVLLEDSFISDDFNETLIKKLKETFPDIYFVLYKANLETLKQCLQDKHEGPFAKWKIRYVLKES